MRVTCGISHPFKACFVQFAALSSHLRRFESNEAIDPHLGGAMPRIPRPGADIDPTIAVLIGVITFAAVSYTHLTLPTKA